MTKEQFLKGSSFSLDGDYSNTTTYRYKNDGARYGGIQREYRMYNDVNNILISDHIMNVEKLGNKMVHLYTFILGKKIVDRIRFKDMIEFPEQVNS
jgi:hypothetical protein